MCDYIASKNCEYSKSIDLLFECEGMDPPMLVPIASSLRLFSNSCSKELAIPAINNLSSFGFVCIHRYHPCNQSPFFSPFISTSLQSITTYINILKNWLSIPAINHQFYQRLYQHPCNQSPVLSTVISTSLQSITSYFTIPTNWSTINHQSF